MTKVSVVYHSGFGHTEVVAKEVGEGLKAAGVEVTLHNVDKLDDALWAALEAADGIVFGSPTYMAGVSAQMKAFMDASSKPWFGQKWKDKMAAGFTNSGSLSGDKVATVQALAAFAAQHSMIWVSQGVFPSQYTGDGKGLNRLGSWLGMMTQSDNVGPEQSPGAEDRAYARAFGTRVGEAVKRWAK